MPVIILGSSGSIPIDPDFDDGGNVQDASTSLDQYIGIVDSPTVTNASTSVSVGIANSSTFFDNTSVPIIPGFVIMTAGGFSIDTVQTIPGVATPDIVTSSLPTASAPTSDPTVGDFDDDGIVQNASTTVENNIGGFITNDPVTSAATTVSSIQAGSSTFTEGNVSNPVHEANTFSIDTTAGSFIPSSDTTTTIPGHVVS